MTDIGENDGSGRVVELTRYRGPGVRPAIAQTEAYWETVRRGRLVPDRAEIDPRGLSGVLGHAFILERIASGLARIRIAGSHLTDLTGLEVRGMPLSALFEPSARDSLADVLRAVFDDPAVLRLELESPGGFGQSDLIGDMILLPLRSDLGEISRILGAVVMTGEIGRTPRRLTLRQTHHRGLVGHGAGADLPLRGFSELDDRDRPGGRPPRPAPSPVLDRSRIVSRAAHLRLIVDNADAG